MNSKPHILFISSWYPNRKQPTHGIFNRHFAEAAAQHHRVSVIHISSEDHLKTEFEFDQVVEKDIFSIQVYYRKVNSLLPLWSAYLKRKRYLKAAEQAYGLLLQKTGKPDLIHLNVVMPAGIAVLHLYQKTGIPFVVNEGWTGYMKADGRYKGWFMKHFTRRVLSPASRILPVSEDLKTAMQAHGLKGHYHVLPNVVQCGVFVPGEKHQDPVTRFIHVSTLDPLQKNVEGIILALKTALETEPRLQLQIAGDGENKAALEKRVKDLNLQNQVSFLGLLGETELARRLGESDALVMFSQFESFGVVIGEALACNTAVICSSCGGLGNLVKDEMGIQVQPGNVTQLTQALLHLSGNKSFFRSEKPRQFILERFSKDVIASEMRTLYGEVLREKR
ncbi:MAG TPA: glycosyltransferase [Bacteroidia bacterium]|nr:glycosyltransferase [Bacteroidia bacterium]